jgi:Putative beta-barrel porin 2
MITSKNMCKVLFLTSLVVPMGVLAQKSEGLRFGNFKLSPYVSLDASYDSNIRLQKNELDDVVYRLNPGLDAEFNGTDWGILGNAWYAYDLYQKYDVLNASRYGEDLEMYVESLKGWKFRMGERYYFSNQNDSNLTGDGSGVWRNRHQFDVHGLMAYEINERLSVGLNAMYTDNWFDSDTEKYQPLYGWSSAQVGAEVDYGITKKTGLILNGSYQMYETEGSLPGEDDTSTGYSVNVGVGSRLTERLKYRLLVGGNVYSYADETTISPALNGSISWQMSQRWALTVASATYYQPSETTRGQAKNIWSLSAGLSYKPTERISMTADIVYRYENNETMVDQSTAKVMCRINMPCVTE